MPNLLLTRASRHAGHAYVALQQVLNANLRGALDSAAWSGFVSYVLGVLFMALLARTPYATLFHPR